MAKIYLYTVTGKGSMPLDMTRYDCAWPREPRDCEHITDSIQDSHSPNVRSVCLVSNQPPTEGRWNSFGWAVTNLIER